MYTHETKSLKYFEKKSLNKIWKTLRASVIKE